MRRFLSLLPLAALSLLACVGCSSQGATNENTGAMGGASTGGADPTTSSGGGPASGGTSNGTPSTGGSSAGGAGSGSSATGGGDGGPTATLLAMSYNLYGWNALTQNPWKGENIVEQIRGYSPDILGFQEAENKAGDLAASLGDTHSVAGTPSAGVALLYRSSVLTLDESGSGNLTEQDQWGQRVYHFAHYKEKTTGRGFYHFNTHFCVCSADQLLGSAKTIVDAIVARKSISDPVILTGDFNVFDGFENSKAVQYFKGGLGSPLTLVDSFRAVHPDDNGATFGAAGKIDYVFLSSALTATEAGIDRTMPDGQGSDHYPIWAKFKL